MTLLRAVLVIAILALGLTGCATAPKDPAARAEFKAHHDPLEPLNRQTFALNLFLDHHLIKPLAKAYKRVIPEKIRDAIHHFLDNVNEPIVLANNLLQGRFKSAAKTTGRFVVNSTAGIGGISDVATKHDLPKQIGDFGQTLAVWGLEEGPYLVLPLFGPSSPRDAVGLGVDVYTDPFRYVARKQNYPTAVSSGRTIADGLDKRARTIEIMDELEHESVDFYASLRSLFRQNRAAEIRGGGAAAPTPPPDIYDDPGR